MIYKINSINEMFDNESSNIVEIILDDIINEDAREIRGVKITSKENGKLYISVDGSGDTDRNWGADPYFKVFVGPDSNANHAALVSRIRFSRAEYVYPPHKPLQKVWYLNSKELKILMKILTSYIVKDGTTKEPIPIWEWMNSFVKEYVLSHKKELEKQGIPIITYYNMPNYLNIK